MSFNIRMEMCTDAHILNFLLRSVGVDEETEQLNNYRVRSVSTMLHFAFFYC